MLTEPGLSTIVHGILIARCIFERIRNFITYRIAATLQLLFFFFIAIFAFRPVDYEPEDQDDHYWPNFFHMPVIMLMLITLLNDGEEQYSYSYSFSLSSPLTLSSYLYSIVTLYYPYFSMHFLFSCDIKSFRMVCSECTTSCWCLFYGMIQLNIPYRTAMYRNAP